MTDPILLASLDRAKVVPLAFDVDGTRYTYRRSDVKIAHEQRLRRETFGELTFASLTNRFLADDVDGEVVAGFLFLARLQAGDDLTFDEAAAMVDGAERIDVSALPLEGDEDDSPEA